MTFSSITDTKFDLVSHFIHFSEYNSFCVLCIGTGLLKISEYCHKLNRNLWKLCLCDVQYRGWFNNICVPRIVATILKQ